MKRRMFNRIFPALFVVVVIATLIWGSDRITLQGERTIYTVDCAQGVWEGNRCTGALTAGPRYAFRASVRRHEVIYWIRDSTAPSGKYSDCTVKNRDNWSCNVEVGQPPAVAYEMHDGRPTRGSIGLSMTFHDVPKWKWWAISYGIGHFTEASD
jgi:hypothetical protein